ncbi:hypothetical protein F1728_03250 [Gimesia benthica]|uniref:Uncharacterized protein n=1 Tax=Gimesia benthica TaxID=2608982 RepID=A0A6I6A884_9PLAN|nr:hypothetical protein [Gimesia benthica]QGQ21762.1 hypothetical protein F1728_03250 [Gimesia benthica]
MSETSPPQKMKQSTRTKIVFGGIMLAVLVLGWGIAVESVIQHDRYWDERIMIPRGSGGIEDELRREQGDLFHSPRFRSSVGEVIVNSIRFLPDVRFFLIEFYDNHPVVVIFFFLIEVGLLWLGYVTVKDDLRSEAEAEREAIREPPQ